MKFSLNKMVATEPFPVRSIQTTVTKGGLVLPEQKTTLTKLRVVFDSESFGADTHVYVRADLCASDWANNVYTIDGSKFILLPESHVLLVESFNDE